MTRAHERVVDDQFGPRAAAYVNSPVHAAGEDLDTLEAIAGRSPLEHALDLGAGGGHVAYRLAAHARRVTACDLSAEMLAAVAATAQVRGLGNIETVLASAEQLPFADATFDFLGCRFTAHHWRDLEGGLREARRVMRAGSTAVFIDAIARASPLLDTHLQAVELLRDTSHVRDYSAHDWLAALGRSGFDIVATRGARLPMEFQSWTDRMQTPELNRQAIRALQVAASAQVREHFAIGANGDFMLDTLLMEVVAR